MSFIKPKSVTPFEMNKDFKRLYLESPASKLYKSSEVDEEFERLYSESPSAKILEDCLKRRSTAGLIRPQSIHSYAHASSKAKILEKIRLSSPAPRPFTSTAAETSTPQHSPVRDDDDHIDSPVQALTPIFLSQNKLNKRTSMKPKSRDSSKSGKEDDRPPDDEDAVPEQSPSDREEKDVYSPFSRRLRPHKKTLAATVSKIKAKEKKQLKSRKSAPPLTTKYVCESRDDTDEPEQDVNLLEDDDPVLKLFPEDQDQGDFVGEKRTTGEEQQTSHVHGHENNANLEHRSHQVDEPEVPDKNGAGLREEDPQHASCDDRREEGDTEERLPAEEGTILENWVVQIHQKGVRVEGHRIGDEEDMFWHSSKIEKRLSSCVLQTGSGSLYRLRGPIDRELALEQGFSEELVEQFADGFPENWQDLIHKHTHRRKRHTSERQKKLGKSNSQPSEIKPSNENKWEKDKKAQAAGSKKTTSTAEKKPAQHKKAKPSQKKRNLTPHAPLLNNTLLVQAGVKQHGTKDDPFIIDQLPRTRRGRTIIPQLAWWTGQQALVLPHTNTLCITPGTPNHLGNDVSFKTTDFKKIQAREERELLRKKESLNSTRDRSLMKPRQQKSETAKSQKSAKDSMKSSQQNFPKEDKPHTELWSRQEQDSSQERGGEERLDESDGSQISQPMTDEEREYSQKLQETLSKIEEDTSVTTDRGGNDRVDCFKGRNLQDDEVDEADDVKQDSDSETGQKKGVSKQGKDFNCSEKRSPHVNLTNVLDIKENTPQAFLKTALRNMQPSEKQNFDTGDDTNDFLPRTRSKKIVPESKTCTHGNRKRLSIQATLTKMRKRHGPRIVEPVKDDICSMTSSSSSEDDDDEFSVAQTRSRGRNRRKPENKSESSAAARKTRKGSKSRSRSREQPGEDQHKKSGVVTKKVQVSEGAEVPSRRVSEVNPEEGSDRHWTDEEIQRYEKARLELPPGEPWFWQALATSVGTRSVQECQQYHFKDAPSAFKKKTTKSRVQKESVTEPSQITGGKGTLKRKRQIRELIENHEKDYSDDIFDSTPFRKTQPVPRLSASTMQSIAEDFRTPGAYKTPSSKRRKIGTTPSDIFETPHQRVKLPDPVSESKTPVSTFLSPGILDSVDRKDIEGYVHRLKKNHRGRQWNILPSKTSKLTLPKQKQKKKPLTDEVAMALFQPTSQPATHDESDEGDYYFSDCNS